MRIGSSSIAIGLILATCALVDFDMHLWDKQDRVIQHDVRGYYGYLPALFIFDDIQLKEEYYDENGALLVWPETTIDGDHFFKYSCGTAILYAPFFFIADAIAGPLGYHDIGYSEPYKLLLVISALVYLFLGLLGLKRALAQLGFSDSTIAIGLLLTGLGTNLFCYATQSAAMPHVYGFFLFTLFLLQTILWFERPTFWRSASVGLVLGLIALVRPTNALIVLFFLLYGLQRVSVVNEQLRMLMNRWPLILLIAGCSLIPWIPQFMYWHAVTGEVLFYSYGEEGFYWTDSHVLDGLFSFRKGWFVYTPLAFLAFFGVPFLNKPADKTRWGLIGFFTLHIYVAFSWWCWWYGGSFGQRVMVESMALLAIPLCALIDVIRKQVATIKALVIVAGLFIIWLNVFQTYQYELGVLHYDAMARELYFKQFGKMEFVEGFDQLTNPIDANKLKYRER